MTECSTLHSGRDLSLNVDWEEPVEEQGVALLLPAVQAADQIGIWWRSRRSMRSP